MGKAASNCTLGKDEQGNIFYLVEGKKYPMIQNPNICEIGFSFEGFVNIPDMEVTKLIMPKKAGGNLSFSIIQV